MIGPAAVGVALAFEAAIGEAPGRVHPVALLGRVVGHLDRDWRRPRAVGVVIAAVLPVAVAVLVGGIVALGIRADPFLGGALAGLIVFSATSLRMLCSVGRRVVDRTDTDREAARDAIPALVGRDADGLSAGELRSAAVESLAENLADGLVAPLTAFAAGSLVSVPVGVGAAAWVKAVNTLDSMLGYRSKPVGWASARLDDATMWLPARITAVLIAVVGLSPGSLLRGRSWAHGPASPNSGWPMATLAALLDVRLTKSGAYVLNPDRDLPTVRAGRRAVRVVAVAGVLSYVVAGGVALC